MSFLRRIFGRGRRDPRVRRVGDTVMFECTGCGRTTAAGRYSYDALLRCDECRRDADQREGGGDAGPPRGDGTIGLGFSAA